ncbi:hypothetical protein ACO2Q8_13100 [Larkinella sp. VNQ87]|uniref:hypothetical protein n=1 Tax=Larkinella sp. VNQ87 TaxID=3400921 RepID=UPI003C020CE0
MKKLLIAGFLGIALNTVSIPMQTQAEQQPAASQDTVRKDTNRMRQSDRMRRGQIDDRRPTGDPKQLLSDSLRRGGATKVDTVRR